MDLLTILSVSAGLLAAVLVNIAIWAPRRLWIKLAALATAACLFPVAYGALSELLGRPKPAQLQLTEIGDGEATVLAAQLQEGEAIYLWLGFPELKEPRSFVLPWSEAMARELHKAQGQAEENGSQVRTRMPLVASQDRDEPMFYAQPRQPPPAKSAETDNAIWFQRPSADDDE